MYIKITGERRIYLKIKRSQGEKITLSVKEIDAKTYSNAKKEEKVELDYLPEIEIGKKIPKIERKTWIFKDYGVEVERTTINGRTRHKLKGSRYDKRDFLGKYADCEAKIRTSEVLRKIEEIRKTGKKITSWEETTLNGTLTTIYEVWSCATTK